MDFWISLFDFVSQIVFLKVVTRQVGKKKFNYPTFDFTSMHNTHRKYTRIGFLDFSI